MSETQDFERWLLEKIFRYSFGIVVPGKIVDADAPEAEHSNDTKLIQGATFESVEDKQ